MSVARGARARLGALVAASLLCLATLCQPASADARVCRQLQAELASARSGGGGSVQYRKYDRAVSAQRQQISIARRQARDAGCGFSVLGGKSACAMLDDRIGKMERNLAALQRKRAQLSVGGLSRRDRSRILAALDANGCRDRRPAQKPRQRSVERPDDGTSLFDRLSGVDGGPREGATRKMGTSVLSEDAESGKWRTLDQGRRVVINGAGREFRTLCVRTCDGYFFPMSSASSTMDFDRDQNNCESVCPGTEIQLFRLRAAEESDAMVSAVTGEPYASLPTAYLYKTEGAPRPEGCGCNPAKNFSIIAGTAPQEEMPAQPIAPVSIVRPGATFGPESHAGTQGISEANPKAAPQAGGERKIRVVGPAFLPDPEAAADLQAPARTKAR